MRIVFIGPPGAGKGTQSKKLVDYLQVPQVSTGDMLRQAKRDGSKSGQLAAEYMDQGKLVPDPIIIDMVGQRIEQPDCARGYLLDGFPRTLGQARSLDSALNDRGTPLSVVLELSVPDDVIRQRLAGRREENARSVNARLDDDPNVIPKRLEQFRRQTMPLLEYYSRQGVLRSVNGIGTPDEVFERIKEILEEVRSQPS